MAISLTRFLCFVPLRVLPQEIAPFRGPVAGERLARPELRYDLSMRIDVDYEN